MPKSKRDRAGNFFVILSFEVWDTYFDRKKGWKSKNLVLYNVIVSSIPLGRWGSENWNWNWLVFSG